MKPKRIILIRHAQSEANVDRNNYGRKPDYAMELTATGLEQALEAGKKLKHIIGPEGAFFYVSPLWRTRQTFEGIAQSLSKDQFRWQEEPRLREQEWGHLRTREECAQIDTERDAFGTFYYRVPAGESAADVFGRVSDFFGTLYRDFEKENYPDNAVIITHGMTLRLFLMRWFHWTVEEFEELANPENCKVVVLEKQENGKYALISELKKHVVKHEYQRPLQVT